GDGGHMAGEGAMLQKIHAYSTSTAVGVPGSAVLYGQPTTITATVTASTGTPTGYVFFRIGNTPLGQVYLDNTGLASLTTSSIPVGTNQTITAEYESDTYYAASNGTGLITVAGVTSVNASPVT